KMPAFEWVHVQLHQQKGMISLSPPTICNSAIQTAPNYISSLWQQRSYISIAAVATIFWLFTKTI
ncbi:hypothetical protein, partial [Escherichia coli]|uniref:hypothetical protein n=2 Tax=Escherichia coli TaxID=562 RepID=UPI0022F02315